MGPDSLGNFATSEVPPSFADDCPRETCTCTSHEDYTTVAKERLDNAIRVHVVEIGKKFEIDIDPALIIDGDAPINQQLTVAEATVHPADKPAEPVVEEPVAVDDTTAPASEDVNTDSSDQTNS